MRIIIITILITFGFYSQGQKKELRKIDKLILESFYEEAKDELDISKSLILSSEEKYKAQFYFYDAKVSNELKDFKTAISSLNSLLKINKSIYPTKVEQEYENLSIIISNSVVNAAVKDNQDGNFLDAADKLIMAYEMDKDQYKDYLYFAAGSAVNGKDYDRALEYYVMLKDMDYTGIIDEYFVTNNETGVEEKVSKTEFDLLKSSKDYSNPRTGQTESRFPEIVKNIALIYVQQGKNDIAEKAIKEAREIQPDDVSLLLNEADLYIRISNNSDDEYEALSYRNKFKDLMQKAIELDPNNGILYYNLGVIYAEQGELELAKEKYTEAIALIPDYVDRPSWYNYSISTSAKLRNQLLKYLERQKIETRLSFPPVHIQPYYKKRFGYNENSFSKALECFQTFIDIPIWADMGLENQSYVQEKIHEFFLKKRF